jgi:hypothetical protein
MNGETIPIAAMKHRIMFSRLHSTLMKRGRGSSLKSGPIKPIDNEMAANGNINRKPSRKATNARSVEEWKANVSTVPTMTVTNVPKKMMKKYLLFTRLSAEMGEAYTRHIA